MVGELARVVKSGGRLILSTPNRHFFGRPGSYRLHLRHYYPGEVLDLLNPLFTQVVLWGQFMDPRYTRLEHSTISRAIVRAKRSLGMSRAIFSGTFRTALSRLLFGVSKEDITPQNIYFAAENIEKCSYIVAICTK